MSLFSEQQLRDMTRKQVHGLVRSLEAEVERVHVQVDGPAWCARHWGVIVLNEDTRCVLADSSEDDGRCVPVPLYVEAPDP